MFISHPQTKTIAPLTMPDTRTLRRAYVELHIAVFLYGFTAVLGELITLNEYHLVWWRTLLTSVSFLFFPKLFSTLRQIPRSLILRYAGVGFLLALNWVVFFGAVKYSNISITLVCMSTVTFFTALLEPLLLQVRYRWYELVLSLLLVPSMYLVVRATPPQMITGVWIGISAAFLSAVFSILNKKYVTHSSPSAITFIEMASGFLLLTVLLPLYQWAMPNAGSLQPMSYDWAYLLVLALLCTTFAYVLTLRSLLHISAYTANLAINLEPVYGILMAWAFFRENEQVGENFYIGVLLILAIVFVHPLVKSFFEK